jgi:small subunit ribosomal protein S9
MFLDKKLHTIGKRKTAIARLYLSTGTGKIIINNINIDKYFKSYFLKDKILQPFFLTKKNGKFDIRIRVFGGGINSQSEAIRLAISRALCEVFPLSRSILKAKGLLTRDSRKVERKKFGRKKARKNFQFSKR